MRAVSVLCRELDVEVVPRAPPSVEYTLIAVKGPDTAKAIEAAAGVPILFQNGIGGLEMARERFPNAIGEVLTYGVNREGCRAELRGVGEIALPCGAGDAVKALDRGESRVRVVDDIEPLRWAKLVVNAATNPVTAILKAPNGVVAENPWARALAERLALEAAEAAGYPVDGPVGTVMAVARATASNISSMAQDLARCRPTEVDFINGTVIKYGEGLGVEAPYNRAMYLIVKALKVSCGF